MGREEKRRKVTFFSLLVSNCFLIPRSEGSTFFSGIKGRLFREMNSQDFPNQTSLVPPGPGWGLLWNGLENYGKLPFSTEKALINLRQFYLNVATKLQSKANQSYMQKNCIAALRPRMAFSFSVTDAAVALTHGLLSYATDHARGSAVIVVLLTGMQQNWNSQIKITQCLWEPTAGEKWLGREWTSREGKGRRARKFPDFIPCPKGKPCLCGTGCILCTWDSKVTSPTCCHGTSMVSSIIATEKTPALPIYFQLQESFLLRDPRTQSRRR